jgi:hypothetical protein
MKDDSLSPVFNLRGCNFTKLSTNEESITNTSSSEIPYKKWDAVSNS